MRFHVLLVVLPAQERVERSCMSTGENWMAQLYERRNGALRTQTDQVREDIGALQKDMSQLRSDVGELIALQWRTLGDSVGGGAAYIGEQVKTRPLASLGLAAGAGIMTGLALASLSGRPTERRRHN